MEVGVLEVVGCNVNNIAVGRLAETVNSLRSIASDSPILLLQEVSSCPNDVQFSGLSVIRNAGTPSAVLIPSSLGMNIRSSTHTSVCPLVVLCDVGIISGYLADSLQSLE